MIDTYKIIRFYQDDREPKIIHEHKTLSEAKEWCQSPESRGTIKAGPHST